ncbi:MAG: hypothetical protein OEO23_06795 [Gemmatimonadota bacterium]|nr:hypothetical protein [Gemmatimonadota bacterium]
MPPELIFIIVLIVFSILESAFKRKRKSRRGPLDGPSGTGLPPGWPPPEKPRERRVPTVPEDVEAAGASSERASQMVPEELWEEIAALARGDVEETLRRRRERAKAQAEQQSGRRPAARRAGAAPIPSRRAELPSPADAAGPALEEAPLRQDPQPVPGEPGVAVGRSQTPRVPQPRPRDGYHAAGIKRAEAKAARQAAMLRGRPGTAEGVGTGATPPKTDADDLRPLRERNEDRREGYEARGAQRLRGAFHGPRALRQAIIAREVLGRPLALRNPGDEDLWSDGP